MMKFQKKRNAIQPDAGVAATESLPTSKATTGQFGHFPSLPSRNFDFYSTGGARAPLLRDLDATEITDVRYLSKGSNAILYTGITGNELVAIKMLKPNLKHKDVAVQEMNIEMEVLSRIDHENIIRISGAGEIPRKFIIVEYLYGGTLDQLISQYKLGLPIQTAITIASELAAALKYLHNDVDPSLMVIHRDLKPQNIGFDADKTLKLFDFGLAACVEKKRTASDTYDMTGYTGTLVYMAPEVVLRKRYNEKVDVYSFAILLWQILSGESPFGNMTKDDHMKLAVLGGQRPHMSTITSRTPVALQNLLIRCWHADYMQRPDFAAIAKELNALKRNPKPITTGSSSSSSSSSSVEVGNGKLFDSKKEKSPSVDTACSEEDYQMESPVKCKLKPTTPTIATTIATTTASTDVVASGVNRRRRGFNTLLFKF